MNSKNIMHALSGISHYMIEEAENYKPKQKINIWVKCGAIAACVILAFSISIMYILLEFPKRQGAQSGDFGDCELSSAYYCSTSFDLFYKDIQNVQTGQSVYNGKYLVLNKKHENGSSCSEQKLIVPNISYEDYTFVVICVDYKNYQYQFLPRDGVEQFDEIVIEVSKTTNSFDNEEERAFNTIDGLYISGEYEGNNLWYLEHDGYLITVALPDHIVFNSEEEVRQHFTFETQILRECEVCKATAE